MDDVQNNVAAAPVVTDHEEQAERWINLQFGWAGKLFELSIADSDRVYDLKVALQNLTSVPPTRQKILGLVKGKLPPEQIRIVDLGLVSGKKFTLIGTPEGDEIKDPSRLEFLPDIVNDLDVDFTEHLEAGVAYQKDKRNIRKIQEATEKLKINIIHPLRKGKKLLVLDIDYTILDTKPLTSGSLPPDECARPRLHEFLEAIYPFYDICIWYASIRTDIYKVGQGNSRSQTSWVWLETKLVELEMLGANRNYQISFVLDKTCMFTVFSERDGKPWSHSVKALQIIWNHFSQFNSSNTIHVDDLSRNFALNPNEGLKISPFKNASTPEALADKELDRLSLYMLHIAKMADFRTLSHKDWKAIVKRLHRS